MHCSNYIYCLLQMTWIDKIIHIFSTVVHALSWLVYRSMWVLCSTHPSFHIKYS
jgi:hypothetical protein